MQKVELHLNAVQDIEQRLGIQDRWTAIHPEYQNTLDYINNRKFIRAVEKLEGLVVQRLFELSKANLSGTGEYHLYTSSFYSLQLVSGYKMRKHISKAITRRSAAIRTALATYNELAPLQQPPRPILQFSDVASYAFLGDFELLKYSRHDIISKPWASAANREIATRYFKIHRAHEEIKRLNMEINRLSIWVDYEDSELLEAASRLDESNPELASEIRTFQAKRQRVNDAHRGCLHSIYRLKGYSGTIPGRPTAADVEVPADLEGSEPIGVDEDDTLDDEIARLAECLDSIT